MTTSVRTKWANHEPPYSPDSPPTLRPKTTPRRLQGRDSVCGTDQTIHASFNGSQRCGSASFEGPLLFPTSPGQLNPPPRWSALVTSSPSPCPLRSRLQQHLHDGPMPRHGSEHQCCTPILHRRAPGHRGTLGKQTRGHAATCRSSLWHLEVARRRWPEEMEMLGTAHWAQAQERLNNNNKQKLDCSHGEVVRDHRSNK